MKGPSPFCFHPSSLIPHPSSLIPHPSSLIPHPSSLIPHPSSLIPHPSSLIPHPSSLIPHPSSLDPQTDLDGPSGICQKPRLLWPRKKYSLFRLYHRRQPLADIPLDSCGRCPFSFSGSSPCSLSGKFGRCGTIRRRCACAMTWRGHAASC